MSLSREIDFVAKALTSDLNRAYVAIEPSLWYSNAALFSIYYYVKDLDFSIARQLRLHFTLLRSLLAREKTEDSRHRLWANNSFVFILNYLRHTTFVMI